MNRRAEVLGYFTREGEMVPFKVRYFDENKAEYINGKISKIYYVKNNGVNKNYRISLENKGKISNHILFNLNNDVNKWFISDNTL